MAKMLIQSESLIAIADAIREKTGSTEQLTLAQMPSEIEGIQTGGSGYTLDEMLSGLQISGEITTEVETIRDYILAKQNGITAINASKCKSVGASAVEYCSSIVTADFPVLEKISANAFRYCDKLTTFNAPNVNTLASSAFNSCVSLEEAIFPLVSTLYGCNAVFSGCTNLKKVRFDSAIELGSNEFTNCKSLEAVVFPALNGTVYTQTFSGCSALKKVDFGGMAKFSRTEVFDECTSLEAVILRGGTLSTLSNTNNFANSGISNGTGFIYVPKALLEEYKIATNWSAYAARLRAIEDYPEICEVIE